jgi:hypothetical protein
MTARTCLWFPARFVTIVLRLPFVFAGLAVDCARTDHDKLILLMLSASQVKIVYSWNMRYEPLGALRLGLIIGY